MSNGFSFHEENLFTYTTILSIVTKQFSILILITISVSLMVQGTNLPNSFALFDARPLTQEEKNIAERDYSSIINHCDSRVVSKSESGPVCDAFMSYFSEQCDKLDNLLSYCNLPGTFDTIFLPLVTYYKFSRTVQQGCLRHQQISQDLICEEFINTLGSVADGYKRVLNTRPHIHIPHSTPYPNALLFPIIGDVVNNYSYPIESAQILATFYDSHGYVVDTKHEYAQDNYLKPGQPSGFMVSQIPANTKYVLTTIFKKSSINKPGVLDLNVTTTNLNPAQVFGTVTNMGTNLTSNVEVTGIFYDKVHNVIDIDTAAVNNGSVLFPNEKGAFRLQPYNNIPSSGNITTYTLSVQSPDYSMMPVAKANTKKS
jgi:hypothetical protein